MLPFPPTPSNVGSKVLIRYTISFLGQTRLSKDAPNILIVRLDDVEVRSWSTFGGGGSTRRRWTASPREGIAYNRFHTTAQPPPTRALLLCGRRKNAHRAFGSGQIAGLANDWDGYSGVIPKSSYPVAQVLKDYGYGHRGVRKMAQLADRADDPPPGRSTIGPRATALNTSTAFSLWRPRSTSRAW